jgi:hypothetical protein
MGRLIRASPMNAELAAVAGLRSNRIQDIIRRMVTPPLPVSHGRPRRSVAAGSSSASVSC